MTPSCVTPAERARKMQSLVLRCLQEPGRQVAIATTLGVSESGISRLKNDHLENLCLMLAYAGLKIVPAEARCYETKDVDAMIHLAKQRMEQIEGAESLAWEGEE